ncbi:hypothetical protein ASPZODRAFT_144060 [Penicilliopsis zonata CBS 506.65]|uniref:Uncharacterized protein n=1 Tax=Penicilliopsis zonata CBS 506.65 TaxID=1073090 RepID=A0A1L9SE21_9EURO|nr:hypothetical protein ASPZODRAFT_144060 [Penicilliopsis zonata CBS 506.65]OJJ45429.1 hypothetical protein ASPZODRAFT_144060 [Penicilliopsis zonata CBS 506.65]
MAPQRSLSFQRLRRLPRMLCRTILRDSWQDALRFYRPLLRSVGLDMVVSSLQRTIDNHKGSERRKPVVDASFRNALFSCGIHILPSILSISLVTINCIGYFIGSELAGIENEDNVKLGAIQIAAKIQELLIVGSTAAIVFHFLRVELLFGDGVPFGLLTAGFDFARLNYFWSSAFLGAMRCREAWRKPFLVTLLVLAGIIAVAAGPSSAVLMVPVSRTWSGGWTAFYLNGTDQDLWPTNVTGSAAGGQSCTTVAGLTDPYCIAGGYSALQQWATTLDFVPGGGTANGPLFHMDVTDQLMQQTMIGYIRQPGSNLDTWAQATHSATAVVQEMLRGAWQTGIHHIGGFRYGRLQYGADSLSSAAVQIPAVRVVCPSFLRVSGNDSTINCPVVPEYDFWANVSSGGTVTWDVNPLTLPQNLSQIWTALDQDAPATGVKTMWTALNETDFGSASAGLLIFDSPARYADVASDESRLAVCCTVDARWAEGHSLISRGDLGGNFYKLSSVSHQRADTSTQEFGPIDDGSYTLIRLALDWLQALTPKMAPMYNATTNQSVAVNSLESIVTSTGLTELDNSTNTAEFVCTAFLEHIVSVLVANGLSRVGLSRQVNYEQFNQLASNYTYATVSGNGDGVLDPRATLSSSPFTRLVMTETTTGYALSVTSWLEYLAVALICLHLGMALIHTGWLLYTRKTSQAWESIPELIALSQNSAPAPRALENTCAGIQSMDTFAEKTCIVATEADVDGSFTHLELFFTRDRPNVCKAQGMPAEGEEYGCVSTGFTVR